MVVGRWLAIYPALIPDQYGKVEISKILLVNFQFYCDEILSYLSPIVIDFNICNHLIRIKIHDKK